MFFLHSLLIIFISTCSINLNLFTVMYILYVCRYFHHESLSHPKNKDSSTHDICPGPVEGNILYSVQENAVLYENISGELFKHHHSTVI